MSEFTEEYLWCVTVNSFDPAVLDVQGKTINSYDM